MVAHPICEWQKSLYCLNPAKMFFNMRYPFHSSSLRMLGVIIVCHCSALTTSMIYTRIVVKASVVMDGVKELSQDLFVGANPYWVTQISTWVEESLELHY